MQIQEHTAAQIRATVTAAAQVADDWAQSSAQTRATLLHGLGDVLVAHREALVGLGDEETSLGPVRLNGELDRTNFQLRAFADHVDAGHAFSVSDDPAIVGAPPL